MPLMSLLRNDWLRLRRSISPLLLLSALVPLCAGGYLAEQTLPSRAYDYSQYGFTLIMAVLLARYAALSSEGRFLRGLPLSTSSLAFYTAAQVKMTLLFVGGVPYFVGLLTSPSGLSAVLLRAALYLLVLAAAAAGSAWFWVLNPTPLGLEGMNTPLKVLFRRFSPIAALELSFYPRNPVLAIFPVSGFVLWILWPFVGSFIEAMLIANFLFLLLLQWAYMALY